MGVLVVTGSSRGIGAEIGRLAAAQGWSVCIDYATSSAEAERVVDHIVAAGGRAIAVGTDVADEGQVEAILTTGD